jgi:uncharacterized protein with LGFP repeats
MERLTPIRIFHLGALLMITILFAACNPKELLGQVIKDPMQSQLTSEEQAAPDIAIKSLYQRLGGEIGLLGQSVSTDLENAGNGWNMWRFRCGRIYSNSKNGTFEVYGPIMNQWLALGGGEGPIGYPTGHPEEAFKGKGLKQAFQYASLLWQGFGQVEIYSSLARLKLIEKAKIGLSR